MIVMSLKMLVRLSCHMLENTRLKQWKGMESMNVNHVLDLVDLPPNRKIIGNKWVLRIKHKADGTCDDLSGWVRGTGNYLMSNPTSHGWLRKELKGKRFLSIITKAFQKYFAKGFIRTSKLSVL